MDFWLYKMNIQHLLSVLGITFNALKRQLLKGIRLEDPVYAPEPIAKLCQNCWIENYEERPPFYNIIDFIRHNFEITKYRLPSSTTNEESKQPNNYSITYAKLNFQELKLRKQFDTIRQSLRNGSSISNTIVDQSRVSNTVSNHAMQGEEERGEDISRLENGSTDANAYRRIDHVKSRALMSLQLELELKNLIQSQGMSDIMNYSFNRHFYIYTFIYACNIFSLFSI